MDSRVPDFPSWRFVWACSLLGFSLAGFFDGILLHQILQWHHLLIALEGAAFADMRVQILADGLFHLFMYVLAFVGLWLLWRARSEFVQPCADKPALAYSLIGFGTWHVIDAFVVHWMLGFHRIRMDADNLLLWDLIWLVLFGVIPLAVGWMMRGGGGGRKLYPGTAAIVLALAVVLTGPLAARPPPDTSGALVLFKAGSSTAERMRAISAIDARVVWIDTSGALWALDLPQPEKARSLYGNGALLVSNSLIAVGCFSWSQPPG